MTVLLQTWLSDQATRRPTSTALVMNQERLTYGQLEASTNRLARLLKDKGCKKGDRVGLLLPKSVRAIISILGVLKADCIYVPLDPASPAARIAKIVDSCESRFLLAAGAVTSLLDELLQPNGRCWSISVGWMDEQSTPSNNWQATFGWQDLQSYPDSPLVSQSQEDDAAHILFTSGSTGTPKGVVITHSNVVHFVHWATKYFGLAPSDRTSGHSPLHFDLSTFDIFGTLAAGAQLHLVPPELNILPNKLAEFIRTAELTQWFSVPSILNYMAKFDVVKFNDFPALRRVLWCGEVFPTPALVYWMKRLPNATFTNLYGPTEATIASSYYSVQKCPEDEKAAIPIGRACEGEELLVLDEKLRPVQSGEVGDLYIRGVGLSPGYWRDPEKTRAAFPPNPHSTEPADRIYKTGDLARVAEDGLVYFVGRVDSQIKCRGYRIELREIETALSALDVLRESAVIAIPTDGFQGNLICCAYVPVPSVQVTTTDIRKQLSKVVPGYMLPSRWKAFDKLPQNPNGKIDRRKITEEFQRDEAKRDFDS
jgi:amino acid adenylation domain-containing protein